MTPRKNTEFPLDYRRGLDGALREWLLFLECITPLLEEVWE